MENTANILSEKTSVRRACIIAVVMFITMVAHYIFKTGISGLLVKAFTAMKMPWLQIADAIVGFIIIGYLFYMRTSRYRFSRAVVIISITVAIGLCILSAFIHPGATNKPVLFMLGLAVNMLVYTATYCSWMLLVTTAFERNWLTLSIVGTGAQLGVLVGSWAGKTLAVPGFIRYLPGTIGVLYVCIFLLLGISIKKFSCGGIVLSNSSNNSIVVRNRLLLWARGIMKQYQHNTNSYIILILSLILTASIFGQTLNWRLQLMADYKTTVAAASNFLGDFYQAMAIIALIVQIVITPLMLRYIPSYAGMLLQPFLGILLAVLIQGNIATNIGLAGMVIFSSLDYTVYYAYKERLWLHVPLFNKVYHKAYAGLLIPKLAALINAASVLLLASHNFSIWVNYVIVIVLLWMVATMVVIWTNTKYSRSGITDYKSSINEV
ncbi:MAG: hypothetical protein J7497_16160 [Chitinophagaceae bacterium]|nr:hypothetical protein [Chitinophagaceae bacterium]